VRLKKKGKKNSVLSRAGDGRKKKKGQYPFPYVGGGHAWCSKGNKHGKAKQNRAKGTAGRRKILSPGGPVKWQAYNLYDWAKGVKEEVKTSEGDFTGLQDRVLRQRDQFFRVGKRREKIFPSQSLKKKDKKKEGKKEKE